MSKESLEQGQQWLVSLLSLCQMPAKVAGEERSNTLEPGVNNWLTIDTENYDLEQIQALIGSGGSVIDAIQSLANATLNQDPDPEAHTYYIVEISQYREQRFQKLKEIGLQAVEQVRATGEEAEIRALSSVDRRHLHQLLKEFPEIETQSHGQEPDRRLIIRLKEPI
jgi:spoIIIJ-associated protein